ncbi:MAG TPA: transglutaminase domain-containing protein, partial [Bacteroidia bacterium]|nr:transglutaminase domain-containing protein [Bacteroidia bacterium]
TNLEAGDGIHITYTVENYNSGKLAPYFTDNHYFTLFYPVKISNYSLLVHPTAKFKHQFSNGGFEPVKSTKEGMDLYVWEKKDIPSIKDEPFMSTIVDFGEVLYLSSIPDWKFVSNWYSDLALTKAKSDFEVKEAAAKIFNDKDGGTNASLSKLDKAKLIHKYIVENIRYSSVSFRQSGLVPQKASKVINTRVGDCKDVSTLFVALCKEAGIDSARLVLINTRDNGKKDLLLPSIDFNHCIGNLTIDGKQYFVELTSDKNGFSTFPNTLKNSFALPVYAENEGKSEEPFYLTAPTKIPDNIIRSSTVKISGKEMVIETKSVKTGDWASEMRYSYADIPESERRKRLLEVLTGDNASVKLNTFTFNNLDAISDSMVYEYNYTQGNAVNQITNLNVFSIPWSGKHTSIQFMSAEERKYPVNFWDYVEFDRSEEKLTVTFPEGKKLAETPKNVKLSCVAADYSLTYKIVNNKLEATRVLTIKKDIVLPAEYNELKKFFEKVVEEDTRQLAYK